MHNEIRLIIKQYVFEIKQDSIDQIKPQEIKREAQGEHAQRRRPVYSQRIFSTFPSI